MFLKIKKNEMVPKKFLYSHKQNSIKRKFSDI